MGSASPFQQGLVSNLTQNPKLKTQNRGARAENSKGAGFVARRPCRLELQTMNFPKRTGNQRGERRGWVEGVQKRDGRILRGQGVGPTYVCALISARVAELADAVDSKSTDESLVGSTPTPGTLFLRGKSKHEGHCCHNFWQQ